MSNSIKDELIDSIKKKLKLEDGFFIDAEIEDYIKDIPEDRCLDFFKALSGDEYNYKNAMDRISIVASKFKAENTKLLLGGTKEQAKAMYDKFYYECCTMLDYTQNNRSTIPNDREWFRSLKYEDLKRKDGTKSYTQQELYVLNELGGGNWLIDIRFADNSQVVIDKIEKIISSAILTKYQGGTAISSNVRKMIGSQ